jgi:hypothetical protein
MIDLSQFVDKNVRVTLRNGCICEGKVLLNTTKSQVTYPYYFKNTAYEGGYTKDGFELDSTEPTAGDTIKIEEIKPMKKYEQLENQVAEMQKEIDRLKREEKNYPNLKLVKIIRTVIYTPEEYFMYCEENEFEASEEGYVEYYSEPEVLDDCFVNRSSYTQEIKVGEN